MIKENYECDGQMDIFNYLGNPERAMLVDVRGLLDNPYCPKCERPLSEEDIDAVVCPECGQRLNWDKFHILNQIE